MVFSLLGDFWWIVPLAMATFFAAFILVSGRRAEGGLKGRTGAGWQKWMTLSRKAGDLLGRIILTIFYFTVVLPFGIARTFLADPLRIRQERRQKAWHTRQTRDLTLDDARRQF